jgi:hypothetical protein
MLPILTSFRPYLGTVHRTIILNTKTGCSWMVKLRDVKGTVFPDQGWHGFAIAHQIKMGYFLTFKVMRGDIFNVTIFDDTMTEVVQRCPHHHPSLAMIED